MSVQLEDDLILEFLFEGRNPAQRCSVFAMSCALEVFEARSHHSAQKHS